MDELAQKLRRVQHAAMAGAPEFPTDDPDIIEYKDDLEARFNIKITPAHRNELVHGRVEGKEPPKRVQRSEE